ncbi:unnamed protein product [Phytomonas sp. Hart1]|nr:unnamed protein product [Phytomonas sp. Hart1]|eukprot:CCW68150.1 unnamed protein product [Phytomonas sp. isolate Hart1]
MRQDELYQDFPFAMRCESSDTVVFVPFAKGARYGDVRKTLAALLGRPFLTTGIASYPLGSPRIASGTVTIPFVDTDEVEVDDGPIMRAHILTKLDSGEWATE